MYTGTVGCHPELCRKTQGSCPTHPPEGVFLGVPPDPRQRGAAPLETQSTRPHFHGNDRYVHTQN